MDYHYGLVVFICCWIPGFGNIPPPINVTMDSFNFRNILRWNRTAELEGDVIYTVQYKIDVKPNKAAYQTICLTRERQCEASIIASKSYVRVSAQLQSSTSQWAAIRFDPYNQTIIGAPDVAVASRSGFLGLRFHGPSVGMDGEPLKEKYGDFIYRVAYWKESEPENILVVNTSENSTILGGLEGWSRYCVRVRVYVPQYDKSGRVSPEICRNTTEDGFGNIPPPINVTMDSFNFRNILRWNRPAGLEGDVTYTVQYKLDVESKVNPYKTICVTLEVQCDSSSVTYISYLRVSAQLKTDRSDWVTIFFDPNSQTIIGAPNLTVASRSGFLDVSFSGPFLGTDRGSLKEKYGDFIYRVAYWKEAEPENVLVFETPQNRDTLHDVESWSMYCVRVQAYIPVYDKAGDFSPEICKETTDDGKISSWKIIVVFLGFLLLAAVVIPGLIFFGIKAYKTIRYVFFPSYSFPQHLKEFLSRPFYNAPFLPPQPVEECGESCSPLTFLSEEAEESTAS